MPPLIWFLILEQVKTSFNILHSMLLLKVIRNGSIFNLSNTQASEVVHEFRENWISLCHSLNIGKVHNKKLLSDVCFVASAKPQMQGFWKNFCRMKYA